MNTCSCAYHYLIFWGDTCGIRSQYHGLRNVNNFIYEIDMKILKSEPIENIQLPQLDFFEIYISKQV